MLAQTGDGRTLARTDDRPAGRRVVRRLRHRAAAGTAQPADAAGAGRAALGRLHRAAGRALAPPAGRAARRRPRHRRHAVLRPAVTILRRALAPFTELREGDIATLLQRDLSVLILADRPLPAGPERDALTQWVREGRPADPLRRPAHGRGNRSARPIRCCRCKLLGGDRQLGGAMSWSEPAGLAPFPSGSPFAGLPVTDEVTVTRQVLAEPSADLAAHTWATLADGTPLVTEATKGAGRIVLFHVTANADWSNLPLSGLFVDMLRRLVALSVGVAAAEGHAMLAPAETLDGFGLLSAPPPAASGLPADAFDSTAGLAAPSARAVRAGERAAGAEPGRRARRRRSRRRWLPAPRVETIGVDRAGAGAGAAAAGAGGAAAGARPADRAGAARPAAPARRRRRGAAAGGAGGGPGARSALETGVQSRRWRRGWATSSPATPRWTAIVEGRAGGAVGIRQPPHRGDAGRTRSGASRARPT